MTGLFTSIGKFDLSNFESKHWQPLKIRETKQLMDIKPLLYIRARCVHIWQITKRKAALIILHSSQTVALDAVAALNAAFDNFFFSYLTNQVENRLRFVHTYLTKPNESPEFRALWCRKKIGEARGFISFPYRRPTSSRVSTKRDRKWEVLMVILF